MKFKIWDKKKAEKYIDDSLIKDKSKINNKYGEEDESNEDSTEDKNISRGYESGTHLQIIKVPDFEYLPSYSEGKYFVAEREPKEVQSTKDSVYSISPINDLLGPYSLSEAIDETVLLYNQASFPIHENIRILRPDDFDDYYHWISCPECAGETEIDTELHIESEREKSSLSIECTECETSVSNEVEKREEFENWASCPICGSTDINYKCSIPYGFINFSCDNCEYNTKPSKTDNGFSKEDINLRDFL